MSNKVYIYKMTPVFYKVFDSYKSAVENVIPETQAKRPGNIILMALLQSGGVFGNGRFLASREKLHED